MAIFYSRAKTIGAKQGSIVKAAAYRTGQKLRRDKTGEIADYSRKQGVIHSEIIVPDAAPSWAQNRGALWNAIEKAEKRKDARYAREIILALPHELTNEQNIVLLQHYIKSNFVPMNMAIDYSIHVPDPAKANDGTYVADQRNIHAHILIADRPLSKDGFASKKNRDWNKVKHIERWRKNWATTLNDAFEAEGLEQRFDHRSYERQGVDFIPQLKEGKIATGMKRRGKALDPDNHSEIISKIEHNQVVREHNDVVRRIEEEKRRQRRRKPKSEQDSNDRDTSKQDTPLESPKRSTTPTTGGSDSDAVQNTRKPVATSAAANNSGDRRRDEQKSPNEDRFLYTLAKLDRRAKFKRRREYYTDARTALEIANQTSRHLGKKNKKASAVNTYRVALADVVKDSNLKSIAYHYHKQTESAMECDRVIRAFMKRRGFSNKEINHAMRRASPAMYRKSKAEALKYARRFDGYLRQKAIKERQVKQQQIERENQQVKRRR